MRRQCAIALRTSVWPVDNSVRVSGVCNDSESRTKRSRSRDREGSSVAG